MSFVSFGFALLLAVVLAGRLTIGRTGRGPAYVALLVAASLTFYAWHVPVYLVILLTSTCVDYTAGLYLGRPARPPRARRAVLIVSLATNLGLLGFFKYADFFVAEVAGAAALLGVTIRAEPLGWVLPMGISFYTFQSMSYTIDVYRGALPAHRGFWKFLLFVGFFPQLMAGPIVRAREFLYQIDRVRRLRLPALAEGGYLIVQGFFLKLVIADQLGVVVDRYWESAAEPGAGSLLALGVVLLFSIQIFCDFAGYTQIARGVGYLLGFRLPVNFDSPYIAASFREFWTRWHITLSQWLRDYLYVSLGGNRRGRGRTLVNLLLVMALGGLWHGAAGTFVVWGLVHGVALVVERMLGLDGRSRPRGPLLTACWFAVVQTTVLFAWTFFRAADLGQAAAVLSNVASLRPGWPEDMPLLAALVVASPAALIHLRSFAVERFGVTCPGVVERGLLAGAMSYAAITCYGVNDAFIYFQF